MGGLVKEIKVGLGQRIKEQREEETGNGGRREKGGEREDEKLCVTFLKPRTVPLLCLSVGHWENDLGLQEAPGSVYCRHHS